VAFIPRFSVTESSYVPGIQSVEMALFGDTLVTAGEKRFSEPLIGLPPFRQQIGLTPNQLGRI